MVEQFTIESMEQGPKLVGNVNKAVTDRCNELGYGGTGIDTIVTGILLYADQQTGGGINKLVSLYGLEVVETIEICMMLTVGIQHLVDIGDPEGLHIQAALAAFVKAYADYDLARQAVTVEEILEKH